MPHIDYCNNIIGQDLASQILKSAVSKKHLAPAYLFSGPKGVGRKNTAKAFIEILIKVKNRIYYILLYIITSKFHYNISN